MLQPYNNKQRYLTNGFSLAEILIVVSLLGMFAAVVIPSLSPNDGKILDTATNEVVRAIRFARSESIRSNISYGVTFDNTNTRLRVYWLDTSGTPTKTYDVRNPIDKNLYEINFASDTYPANLSSVSLIYATASTQNFIAFAATTGTPKFNDGGTIRLLDTATIKVAYRNEERTISITSMTGRVTVQ